MEADCVDFMDGLDRMTGLPKPLLRLVDTSTEPVCASSLTNADRKENDRALLDLGWVRRVEREYDSDGQVTKTTVWYSHPEFPNIDPAAWLNGNTSDRGWTQQTAMLLAGLLTGRARHTDGA